MLAAAARQLLTPLRAPLVEGQELVLVLRATERTRLTGAQWRRLLTVPRAELGGRGDARADELYEYLQAMATRYLIPVGEVEPSPALPLLPAVLETIEPATAPPAGRLADEAPTARPRGPKTGAARTKPAPPAAQAGGLATSGAAAGLALPPLTDPAWKGIPLPLRTEAAGAGARLLTRVRGALEQQENREVLFALRAASNKRAAPRHWHALLTAPREVFGSERNAGADVLYATLQRIAAEYLGPSLAAHTGETVDPSSAS